MAEEKTYLELSEADSGSHKFYEVTINETQGTIRCNRIVDAGPTQTITLVFRVKLSAYRSIFSSY